jgi:hypothetical protein
MLDDSYMSYAIARKGPDGSVKQDALRISRAKQRLSIPPPQRRS